MSNVKLTIDGIELLAPAGITVLEAAQQAGITIPTLCYEPELTKPGSCRICVVEIVGMRNLPISCATVVAEGMVVHTNTDQVREARKTIIELLVANHPLDCMTCDKNGACTLQDLAYQYGVGEVSFSGAKNQYKKDSDNALIERDMNKCILCGKCVRGCSEIPGKDIFDFAHRGFFTKVTTACDQPLDKSQCVFCGTCVALCPTGALLPKQMKGKGRPWEVEKVLTTCPYCGTGCNFYLVVKAGQVIGVESTPEAEVNGHALCVKGRFGYEFIHHRERLKKPLVRKEGQLVETSWEEALEVVAQSLSSVKERFGADAIAGLSSARCTTEENYLMNKFMRGVIGTNNIDHCARL